MKEIVRWLDNEGLAIRSSHRKDNRIDVELCHAPTGASLFCTGGPDGRAMKYTCENIPAQDLFISIKQDMTTKASTRGRMFFVKKGDFFKEVDINLFKRDMAPQTSASRGEELALVLRGFHGQGDVRRLLLGCLYAQRCTDRPSMVVPGYWAASHATKAGRFLDRNEDDLLQSLKQIYFHGRAEKFRTHGKLVDLDQLLAAPWKPLVRFNKLYGIDWWDEETVSYLSTCMRMKKMTRPEISAALIPNSAVTIPDGIELLPGDYIHVR